MDHSQRTQQVTQTRLLAMIAFLLVAFALRQTYAVTMPLQRPCRHRRCLAGRNHGCTLCAGDVQRHQHDSALLPAGFFAACHFLLRRSDRAGFRRKFWKAAAALRKSLRLGAELGGSIGGVGGYGRMIDFAQQALTSVYNIIAYIGVIGVLVAFGLPEVTVAAQEIGQQLGGVKDANSSTPSTRPP